MAESDPIVFGKALSAGLKALPPFVHLLISLLKQKGTSPRVRAKGGC